MIIPATDDRIDTLWEDVVVRRPGNVVSLGGRISMTQDAADALEPYRKYLHVLAGLHLDPRLRGKLDPSDVVQQTMLRASSALAEVRDARPEILVAWLRRILARTLADAAKHYERDKRDVGVERSLEAELNRSASGFAAWLAADQTSPSGLAERNEELLRMVEALSELPETMREVVVLKHCQGWTLAQIAERTGRSVPSVASLLRRGLAELRHRLKTGG
jgi:RNA polymerase sigma-70 factor, ECF subfamily